MKINQITDYLESVAPLHLQEDYDNAGLLIGNNEDQVSGVLISLDCTEAVIDEAIKKNCNLIISHHPILFKGLKKITGRNYIERVVEKSIRNNIALYAIHTNLDNVSGGVSKKLAEQIGLQRTTILMPHPDYPKTGAGIIGMLSKPLNGMQFLKRVKGKLKAGQIRYTDLPEKKIEKVAVCGGSGSFLLEHAIKQKADAFITADFKYHQFFDAENQILIVDVGHYESEQFTPLLLRDLLRKKFGIFAPPQRKVKKNTRSSKTANIPLFLSAVRTNPINYL